MKGNYDNVALFYDWLSQLVFGGAILQSQVFLVGAIPSDCSIIIIGGGAGQILEEISKKHVRGLKITYVEISEKMIARAKKKDVGNNSLVFINQSILDVILPKQFDVVLTAFLFDNYSAKTGKIIFNKIDSFLKPGGLWLFTDFQMSEKNNLWQKLLLKSMYFFFKILCEIEATHLHDFSWFFSESKYKLVSIQTFFRKFIYSAIYSKPGRTESET